eukprot:gene6761-8657_t
MRHMVYSVVDRTDVRVDSGQLQPSVRALRETIGIKLRERYLHLNLKQLRPEWYTLICKATLLDPRFKDFRFFKCQQYAADQTTFARSPLSERLYQDSVKMVREDMVTLLTNLVHHQDEHTPRLASLWNILRAIRTPVGARNQISGDVLVGGNVYGRGMNNSMPFGMLPSESGIQSNSILGTPTGVGMTVEEEDLLCMMGVSKKRKISGMAPVYSGITEDDPFRGAAMLDSVDAVSERRRRIELTCQDELDRYIQTEIPCPPSEVLNTNILRWWCNNSESFPLLSILARRAHSIRTSVSGQARALEVYQGMFCKERRLISPGLVDTVMFLYVNGILSTWTPDDIFNTGLPPTAASVASRACSSDYNTQTVSASGRHQEPGYGPSAMHDMETVINNNNLKAMVAMLNNNRNTNNMNESSGDYTEDFRHLKALRSESSNVGDGGMTDADHAEAAHELIQRHHEVMRGAVVHPDVMMPSLPSLPSDPFHLGDSMS